MSLATRTKLLWDSQELAQVQALFDARKTVFEIAEELKRTPYAVAAKLVLLGRIVQGDNYDYFEVDQVPWAIGVEMQDHQAMHRKPAQRPERNMEVWTPSELARVVAMMDQGKTIFEIAKAVERTPYAVLGRLPRLIRQGDMNYYRVKPTPWALASELKAHRDKEMSLQTLAPESCKT